MSKRGVDMHSVEAALSVRAMHPKGEIPNPSRVAVTTPDYPGELRGGKASQDESGDELRIGHEEANRQ